MQMGTVAFRQDKLEADVAAIATVDTHCEVCHVRFWHKDLATATDFGEDENTACRQYADNSCCTKDTAMKYVQGIGEVCGVWCSRKAWCRSDITCWVL